MSEEKQNIVIRDLQTSKEDEKVNIAVEVEHFGDVKYIRYADVKILEKIEKGDAEPQGGIDVDFSYMLLDSNKQEIEDISPNQEATAKGILEIVFSEVITNYAKSKAS